MYAGYDAGVTKERIGADEEGHWENDRIIADKYRLIRPLGSGGTASVYLAEDMHLHKTWAVKCIRRSHDRRIQESALAEAHMLKRLEHPAFPGIVDIISDMDTVYIIMDYIAGETLTEKLQREGRLDERSVIRMGIQLCDMMSYLHDCSPPVVYRDLKPSNILIDSSGNLHLVDFGTASDGAYTSGALYGMGTPGFSAPEQRGSGRPPDVRMDVYGIGATLLYLYTGSVYQNEETAVRRQRQEWRQRRTQRQARRRMQTLFKFRKGRKTDGSFIPLRGVLLRSVRTVPQERYGSCRRLKAALLQCERGMYRERHRYISMGLLLAVITSVCTGIIFMQDIRIQIKAHIYEEHISRPEILGKEVQLEGLIAAADMYPEREEAYTELLLLYRRWDCFDETAGQIFEILYRNYIAAADRNTEAYVCLNSMAGITWLFFYTGGDNSFRTRVLKAFSYLELAHEAGIPAGMDALGESCYQLCDFYQRYMMTMSWLQEPSEDEYLELPRIISDCMDTIERCSENAAIGIRLTAYQEFLRIIYNCSAGFASYSVEKGVLLQLCDRIREVSETIQVTLPELLQQQQAVILEVERCRLALEKVYAGDGE